MKVCNTTYDHVTNNGRGLAEKEIDVSHESIHLWQMSVTWQYHRNRHDYRAMQDLVG